MSPKPATVETLQQRVERTAAEHAEAARAVQQQQAEQARRLDEHRAAADRRLVADYDARPHDAAVDAARADLDQAVRESPPTQAAAGYLAAQVRRYEAATEMLAARARLGMPTAGAYLPAVAAVASLDAYTTAAVTALAHDQNDADRATRNEEGTTP